MKNRLLILLLAFVVLTTQSFARAKQPLTVREFFMALPDRYMSFDCCHHLPARQRKAEYLKRYLNVEDTANGYMSGHGDGAHEGFTMVLFKRPNGRYIIAFQTYDEGDPEDPPRHLFLDYNNGKWTDISRQVIPNYSVENIYELPRYGTTVKVYEVVDGDQRHLYDLVWKNDKFTRSETTKNEE